jgi:hypothetical protein
VPKKTIEIEDVLPDCVQQAIDETRKLLVSWLADSGDVDETEPPCLSNDLDYSGGFHEIVDNAVPIWTNQIEAAWYLHGRDLEEAYETYGIGENTRENDGKVAIYCYIEQKVAEWYHDNSRTVFEDWKATKEKSHDEE